MRAARALLLAVSCWGCSGPPGVLGGPDATPPADAAPPDARPADAALPTLGPAVYFDDVHIASFTEELHAFALLGQLLNPQLEMAVANGTLSWGLELRELADPSGQSAEMVPARFHNLTDTDQDPANNGDPDAPEFFRPTELLLFEDTTVAAGGALHAAGPQSLGLPGMIPLPFQEPEIEGDLEPTGDEEDPAIRTLENGRLRGAVPVMALSFIPNLTGGMCPGSTLLDVLVLGCGLISVQPDVDLDDDGLERFYDDDGDGQVDRCVDGDGSELLGTSCVSDPRFADGYRLVFVIHGVRAILLAP